jgi:hypothetical protein
MPDEPRGTRVIRDTEKTIATEPAKPKKRKKKRANFPHYDQALVEQKALERQGDLTGTKGRKKPKNGGVLNTLHPNKYATLVSAFRIRPGVVSHAAKAAGVDFTTAKKAWLVGFDYMNKPAIRVLLEEEMILARGMMDEGRLQGEKKLAEEKVVSDYLAKEKAKKDQAKARSEEAKMVRGMRDNVIKLSTITGRALQGLLQQAAKIERELRRGIDEATGKKMSIRQKMVALNRLSLLISRSAQAGNDVIRMERVLLGEPTDIIGHQIQGLDMDQAKNKLDEANAMWDRIQARKDRGLKLIEGTIAEKAS